MTDDYAIEGEDAGYVPCLELPAQLVIEEEGAISGHATGFVAVETQASALPATEREAIVGSAVGFVPRPCCDVDWIYWVWYEHFVPDSAPDGVINALLGPEDNEAKYTGTITADASDGGRTWLFAEAVIDCPQLVFADGQLELYYEVEQETDHLVFTNPAVDRVEVEQLGHLWLDFGPPRPELTGDNGYHVIFYFNDEVPLTEGLDPDYWTMNTSSYGGTFVSDTTYALPSGTSTPSFEAGTRYSIRVSIDVDGSPWKVRAKLWKKSDTEPVAWMFQISGSNVQLTHTPFRRLRYPVSAQVLAHLGRTLQFDVGERHLMALELNDITLSPQP